MMQANKAWQAAADECSKKLMRGARMIDMKYRRIMDKACTTYPQVHPDILFVEFSKLSTVNTHL
jgi:hypothetical protein